MIPEQKIYHRSQGAGTVYPKNIVHSLSIKAGNYTIYDDFANDPRDFGRAAVLYHYPLQRRQAHHLEIHVHCLRNQIPL